MAVTCIAEEYCYKQSIFLLRKIMVFSVSAKLRNRLLASSCLSVCPHGTTRLPLDEFS